MLRENLNGLIAMLAEHKDGGIELSPAAVTDLITVLANCLAEAVALEETVDDLLEGHDIPPDVLKIAQLLARHGVSAGLPKDQALRHGAGA